MALPHGFAADSRAVFLRVGSANYAATVYLDGCKIGSHEGGHLPFQFDVSAALRSAARPEVTVAIRVDGLLSPKRMPPGDLSQRPPQYPNVNYDFFPYAGARPTAQLLRNVASGGCALLALA